MPSLINQKTGSIDWNTYLQNSISAQTLLKRIGFQVKHCQYIKETLSTFLKGFSEREECASFVSRVLFPKRSLMSSTDIIPWRILRSGVVEVAAFSSHQRCWWFKPLRWSWSHKHESLCFYHKCGCLCCKGLIETSSWIQSLHVVVSISSTCGSNRMLVV